MTSEYPPGVTRLILKINSVGGDIESSIGLYHYLKMLPYPIETVNMGSVRSAAILPYLAGSTRSACAHFDFTFHPITLNLNEICGASKLEEYVTTLNADINNYAGIVLHEAPSFSDHYQIHSLLRNESLTLTSVADCISCGILTTVTTT